MDDEDVVTCLDDNTVFTKSSHSVTSPHASVASMYYDTPATEKLAAKCWLCQKDVIPNQLWDFSVSKNRVRFSCCGREETAMLTDDQIKESNRSGIYWAFLQ